jgi:UDP-glucose 4-epimerase
MNPITKRGNLLVAGGLGYIGSHIIVELLTEVKHKLGFDKIIIVDNLSNSKQIVFENIKKMPQGRDVHFVNVDLADQKKLKATFKKFKTIGTVLYCTGMPKPSLH